MTSLPKFKPRDYQQIGTQFMIDHPRCMIIAEPGMGKTGMTLSLLGALKLVGSNFLPALVLAPKRVADVVWAGEAKKWSTFSDLSVVQITGTEKQRLEILSAPRSDVYICNYELVEWLVAAREVAVPRHRRRRVEPVERVSPQQGYEALDRAREDISVHRSMDLLNWNTMSAGAQRFVGSILFSGPGPAAQALVHSVHGGILHREPVHETDHHAARRGGRHT